MGIRLPALGACCLAALSVCAPGLSVRPAAALEAYSLTTPGAPEDVRDAIAAASLLHELRRQDDATAQDVLAAARADYGRILGALYAEGYYAGVINITLDGREAAEIPPLEAPTAIASVTVRVQTGPRFSFSAARMRPYARGTDIPSDYGDTRPARSTAIVAAAEAGVAGWRDLGHAKARVSDQSVQADHRSNTVDALILLDPGPRVTFGELSLSGYKRMDPRRLAKIAGFPTGRVFDPEELARVADRLQRTGVFRSVALTEADRPNADGSLDFALVVAEEPLRRIGAGAEVASFDGLTLTGYWLHRNLLGGAERLTVEGEVAGIGGQTGQEDYRLGVRVDRPATLTPDTSAFVRAEAERRTEEDYTSEGVLAGIGFTHVFSPTLTAEIALSYAATRVIDDGGSRTFRRIELPVSATWDRRDSRLDPSEGFYVQGTAQPFLGLGTTGSGAQLRADLRGYRGFGAGERPIVLAGRVQAGTVFGPSIEDTPRDYLFYSGGGGTVRGHPFQSLGVSVIDGGATETGGMSFVALSAEARVPVGERFSVVAFYDAGFVGEEELYGGSGEWHSGAGLGIRYDTGIGPIRIDVAAPVSGDTDEGVQFYIGIGQSF